MTDLARPRLIGLDAEEARERLERDGPNVLPVSHREGPVRQLVREMVHFFALLFWVAALLALVAGMPQLAVAIVLVIVINGVFAFAQERRAAHAAASLTNLLPLRCTVVRGGVEQVIDATELVVDDVVVLREGDRISADLTLEHVAALALDTSSLTGESVSTHPDVGSLAHAGCFVVEGEGVAIVIATGARTRLAQIAHLAFMEHRPSTPLRRELERVSKIIAITAVVVGVAAFGLALLLGTPASDGFLFAIGVTVALVPEGLLPTVTISLALGAQHMAARHALVRHLESVETLGSTTFICTDKTGTLTRNEMTVVEVWLPDGVAIIDGQGYGPDAAIDCRPLSARSSLDRVAMVAARCGSGRAVERDGAWMAHGDPMEAALDALARRCGIETPLDDPRSIRRFPFDPRRRRMSIVVDGEIMVKGAPDSVLDRCIDPVGAAEAMEAMTRRGLRVLAVAQRGADGPLDEAEVVEDRLELLGLVALEDPPRRGAADSIAACRRAGISIAMVTGDHPETARAIATEVGLLLDDAVVMTGAELPRDDDELADAIDIDGIVIARVDPEDKLRIARVLQERGHVVAMTGDGVNDAPALHEAAIGIAMGVGGTDVARDAADLVLLDDDFATIVRAIEQGRATFANIRRFLTYHLTANVAELTPFIVWALTSGNVPLALGVLQILAFDIGADVLPALALGVEPAGAHVLDHRPTRRHLLDRAVLVRSFGVLGPTEAVVSMAAFVVVLLVGGWRYGDEPATAVALTASGAAFASIVLAQAANAFACRSTVRPVWRIVPPVTRTVAFAVMVQLALLVVFLVPPMAGVLDQSRPTLLGLCIGLCAIPAIVIVDAVHKWRVRH